MNRKRAFTLIELLVVIAIIAILAAILFPVFAQAKLAAKKAASLSNVKQITLSNIMYENDYDDNFVIASQGVWNTGCGIPALSSSFACVSNFATPALEWNLLLEPYIKSLGLFVDPGTGDPQNIFGSNPYTAAEKLALENGGSQYGYNNIFLAPIEILGSNTGGWVPTMGAPLNAVSISRSSTAAVNPAGTPMFTSAQHGSPQLFPFPPTSFPPVATSTSAANETGEPDVAFANPPGLGLALFNATDRLELVGSSSKAPVWYGNWVGVTPFGPLTSTVRCLAPYATGAPVGFVDGHAKSMSAGALAAGTDWASSTTSESSGNGSVVTNLNNYIWTLDGTLNDAN